MTGLAALTGATGFLGRHAVAALESAGWRLRLLVRGDPGDVPRTADIVSGSLADRGALEALVDGADAVIHIAGAITARSRADFMAANRDGTAGLADAWRARAPRARFVLVSSLAAREPRLSHYAESKAAGEAALAPGEAVILRPTVIYGPGDRATLDLFRATRWPVQPLLNGPAARVPLVYAGDVAAAIAAAAGPGMPRRTYELTDRRTEGYGWREIVEAACRACGRAARPVRVPAGILAIGGLAGELTARLGGNPRLTSGKVREVLHADWGSSPDAQPPPEHWQAEYGIERGFAATVAWYRAAGWLPAGVVGAP